VVEPPAHVSRARGSTSTNLAIVAFIVIAFALSGALSLLVGLTGGRHSRFAALGFVSMLLPAAAALAVRAAMNERPRIDWRRFPPEYLPLALFLMPCALHAAMLSLAATAGPLPWQNWLTPQADGLYHVPPPRGWGVLTTYGLITRVAVNAVVGLAVVSFLAMFEEVGWRAWLLPRLSDRVGARAAIVVTSAIWGCWHAPFALAGIQHVDGISPAGLALGAPFGIFAAGLVIGWLWVRTRSIWIVALAHGSLNNWGEYAFKYMRDLVTPSPGALLAVGFVALFVVGVLLLTLGLSPSSTRAGASCRSSVSAA
jgi:membrane protease YdiL (CAAX protease family)